MPEYLAPGVYVEETSFRAKTIEGVSTSIAGFIGPTRYGPVGGEPELMTSFTEFERVYGGIDEFGFRATANASQTTSVDNFMAHGVRAFFDNGGTKLYVCRVFGDDEDTEAYGVASLALGGSPPSLTLTARFPGDAGNMTVRVQAKLSENVLGGSTGSPSISNKVQKDDVVFIGGTVPGGSPPGSLTSSPPAAMSPPGFYGLYDASKASDGTWEFKNGGGTVTEAELDPDEHVVYVVSALLSTQGSGRFDVEQPFGEFAFSPDRNDSLTNYFVEHPSSRRRALSLPLWFDVASGQTGADLARLLLPDLEDKLQLEHEADPPDSNLRQNRETVRNARVAASKAQLATHTLTGGHDGMSPGPIDYEGREETLSLGGGQQTMWKFGLVAFEDVEDISILAAPGYSARLGDPNTVQEAEQIQSHLLNHCNKMRYRIAVLDSGPGYAISEVRAQRSKIDDLRGALYYPWIKIVDPLAERGTPQADAELLLPPSGYVSGIYARNDVERGVHKSPANEVVRGAVGFEFLLNKSQQDVLNPDGINAFRFFEGRGYRLWGARTTTSDPEWKYVNVRRYFMYLERSIEKGTQWVVFENNAHELWAKVTRTIEDFLFNEWNNGALFGAKPEEAYFVRCDRTTMTQNDIDNGRLVCLIGVAPMRPAEFVIFRIGQWTADAS